MGTKLEIFQPLTIADAESRLKYKSSNALQDTGLVNSLDWGNSVSALSEMCVSKYDSALVQEMEYFKDQSLGILHELLLLTFSSRVYVDDTPR